MLVTEQFVMINCQKTGSTFCRQAIKEAEERRARRQRWPRRFGLCRCFLRELMMHDGVQLHQHGSVSDIPVEYRARKIVSVLRDPFSRLESLYKFGWWKDHLRPHEEGPVHRRFPHFPDLGLAEFHEMQMMRLGLPERDIGYQTVKFVRMYFRDPEAALERIDDRFVASGEWRRHMPSMTWLRQGSLRAELRDYLLRHGFRPSDVDFIGERPAENVSAKVPLEWTEDLVEQVQRDERHLLGMLAQLGYPAVPPLAIKSCCRDSGHCESSATRR